MVEGCWLRYRIGFVWFRLAWDRVCMPCYYPTLDGICGLSQMDVHITPVACLILRCHIVCFCVHCHASRAYPHIYGLRCYCGLCIIPCLLYGIAYTLPTSLHYLRLVSYRYHDILLDMHQCYSERITLTTYLHKNPRTKFCLL